MSESSSTRGASLEDVSLRAEGGDEAQRLVAIAALGMCHALASGVVTAAYACQQLLGPALLARLETPGVHPELRRAIHLATELEDVADLVPDKLHVSITEIENKLLAVLSSLASAEVTGAKWLVKRPVPAPH
ncbi:DUF3969 family protein [Myxococcus sp. CA051A]|uniref:DUF3969 family protein n=1 Tax=unclassified Myxococcus TaxID=2648731 RepID=UPI00157B21D0|nr:MULTISPECIES: DUF3969 family protein [unclassified Myxococcus]NTX14301.1 DUF3969 family protein [Myxococcus sp. CA056]NTX41277.1 DUF3969 family protein [Myxococcus sp. CA033]NTX67126.1 DUF3969 family protein [Myxococcus sp. CA051A]